MKLAACPCYVAHTSQQHRFYVSTSILPAIYICRSTSIHGSVDFFRPSATLFQTAILYERSTTTISAATCVSSVEPATASARRTAPQIDSQLRVHDSVPVRRRRRARRPPASKAATRRARSTPSVVKRPRARRPGKK